MRSSPPCSQLPAYAELQAVSNFSFLEGGSHPDELVAQAKALGLAALGIADRNTVAGVVRAHAAAKQVGLRFLPGARLDLRCGTRLICYPTDRAAWGRLCRLLSLGNEHAPKGECHLNLEDVAAHAEGQVLIVVPPDDWDWREALRGAGKRKGEVTTTANIIRLDQARSQLRCEWGQPHTPPGGHLPDPPSFVTEPSPKLPSAK
jgi:error-prone DNA polymerase